jgi:NAD(P)-dependent dehydrogenase (short-subunit alcohol dehydrogenase family)
LAIGAGVAGAAAYLALRRSGTSFRGKTVVITGGSRGLGLELARRWAAEGARVVICARTGRDIDHAVRELRGRGGNAHGFECDVTAADQIRNFIDQVIRRFGRIDVLVNNAGIIQVGPCQNMTDDDYREAMDTHFWGPLHMIEAVVPHMRRRGEGRIMNISSIGGEISVPHLLPYCASKFALTGLSEGLTTELASCGIKVTTVCPGLMRTGSPRNAKFKGQHRKEYAWFSVNAGAPALTISSSRAAAQIVEACRHGRPYLAVSVPAKVAIRLYKLFPDLTLAALSLVNHLLPKPGGSAGFINREGKQSFSSVSPSLLTWLNERAAAANNELR